MVLADKGYYGGQDIKNTQDAGMIPLVEIPSGSILSSLNTENQHRKNTLKQHLLFAFGGQLGD